MVLRESAQRLPVPKGTTIGTVGGVVVGTAIVKAGIVSDIMIVAVTLTALGLFTPLHGNGGPPGGGCSGFISSWRRFGGAIGWSSPPSRSWSTSPRSTIMRYHISPRLPPSASGTSWIRGFGLPAHGCAVGQRTLCGSRNPNILLPWDLGWSLSPSRCLYRHPGRPAHVPVPETGGSTGRSPAGLSPVPRLLAVFLMGFVLDAFRHRA